MRFDCLGGSVKQLPQEQLVDRRMPIAHDMILVRRPSRYPRYRPARRGDIGEDAGDKKSTVPGKTHKSVKNNAAAKFPTRGRGLGTKG